MAEGGSRMTDRRLLIPRITLLILVAPVFVSGVGRQAGAPVPVTGIDHAALRVTDLAGARGFYGAVLGLSEQASGNGTVFHVGDRQRIIVEPGLQPGDD